MDSSHIPHHVAVIADGNRRWAKMRSLPTIEGHRRGAENFITLSRHARKIGINVFTLWGFSTENWKRTKEEVGYLMGLFEHMIDRELKESLKEKTRIVHLGRKDRFTQSLQKKIQEAEEKTKHNHTYHLVIALDYGGRDELERAVNKMVAKQSKQTYGIQDIEGFLDTSVLPYPNPDLIIRTSGEVRLSGFMPLQSEYSEFYFSPTLFPDFGVGALDEAVNEFIQRKRRFGT